MVCTSSEGRMKRKLWGCWVRLGLAVIAFAAATTEASAQRCNRPDPPDIPSGYYAEDYEMEAAENEVRDYLSEMQDYVDCLAREQKDAQGEADSVLDEWNAAVSAYNSR